ncbi:MAG: DUF3014 domain-containing protein [Chromatocurvus sp.]
MQANRNERLSQDNERQRHSTQTIVTAISVLILAVFAWLMLRDDSEPAAEPDAAESTATQAAAPAEPTSPPAPDIPATVQTSEFAETADAEAGDPDSVDTDAESTPGAAAAPAEPPLTLGNSDERLRDELAGTLPGGMPEDVLGNSNLVERGAAAIDSVRRGLVPDKLLNLQRPKGAFKVRSEGDRTVIDPASYRRYDSIVTSLVETPVAPVVGAFQRFRPLLEDAYGALGYAPDEMDNALIAALDEILATPVIEESVAVERSEAVWAYAREDLESLSLLQKQLLRTGPDNVRQLRTKARALREALLNP